MTPKLFLCGDLHYKINNLSSMKVLEDEIVKKLEKYEPNGIVFLGDIGDGHAQIHSDTLNAAIKFMLRCRQYTVIYILIGNHDYPSNRVFLEDRHAFNALKEYPGIRIIDIPTNFSFDGEKFAAIPFVPNGRFAEAYDLLSDKDVSLVLAHQEFAGSCYNGIESSSPDTWPLENPLLISGHIHQHQILQPNLIYLGTPMAVSFGEEDEKHIALLTIENGKTDIKYIQLNVPKKITIDADLTSIQSLTFDDISSYRIRLKCAIEEWTTFRKSSKYKKLIEKGVKVIPETVQVKIQNNGKKVSYLDLFNEMIKKEGNNDLEVLWKDIIKEVG